MTGRDPAIERALLDLACVGAHRAFRVDAGNLRERVAGRLELGQRRFGDSFLAPRWDGLSELLEELEDAVAYVLLETQRLHNADRLDLATAAALTATTVHVVTADAHARQAIAARTQWART